MDPMELEALKIVAEENYAHARDHEQLSELLPVS